MKLPKFFVQFLIGLMLFVGLSNAVHQAMATPAPSNLSADACQQAWFDKQEINAGCFDAVGADGLVIITYNMVDGYDPNAQTLEFFTRNGEGVQLYHRSQVTTSRRGAFEEIQSTLMDYTTDDVGLSGFPMFSLAGFDEFVEGDYAFLHGRIGDGNDGSGIGSNACFRVIRGWDYLRAEIDRIQQSGGTVYYVLRIVE